MRSLYTEDIVGTKPKLTIFDKGYYKQQHDKEVKRSVRNPQKKSQYEWYVPVPKTSRPEYHWEPYRNTIKLISQHTGLSRSMHYESLKKQNDNSQPQRTRNYSLLSQSGSTTLNKSKITVNEGNNPYYPHKIRDSNDRSVSTQFTGNRNWNYSPSPQINLPDPRSEYISRWIKL